MFIGIHNTLVTIHVLHVHISHNIQNVQTVFERLQKVDLTLKLKKCNFGVEDCVYLGHRVGKGGVHPEQTKIEAISKMP